MTMEEALRVLGKFSFEHDLEVAPWAEEEWQTFLDVMDDETKKAFRIVFDGYKGNQ